uniref:Putative secreted peptide n=1 Tax=Anopheles braziliensis TaxID=58242 RepID=A0A2M3ZRK2_9DIPT
MVAPFCFFVAITVLAATSFATCAAAGLTCSMSDSDSEEAISWRFSSKFSRSIEVLRCGVTVIVTDFCIVSTLWL